MGDDSKNHLMSNQSRRSFVASALALPLIVSKVPAWSSLLSQALSVTSPNGKVRFELESPNGPQLQYQITFENRPVIERSHLGVVVTSPDVVNSAEGLESHVAGTPTAYRLHESFVTRGLHSQGVNRCNGVRFNIAGTTNYVLEVRAFDDGVAFRYVIPGRDELRVPHETTSFAIPDESVVWFHDFQGHYEGVHAKKNIADVKNGEWAAPPLTIKLPGNAGYASLTEAALINFAGMGLQADGQRGFKLILGDQLPVSYPFELRYGKSEAARLSRPAAIRGTITSPWRVVMIGADLNALVNCQIVEAVSPPPNRKLFALGAQTNWVKPGRAVWKYLDGGQSTLEGMKEFSRLAGELGFEYNVVEGFWQRWTEGQMKELVDYANGYKVGTWFWKHSKDLRTPYARRQFFELCNRVGVVGAKIDFFDHEAKEIIDLYQALLRDAAAHQIMLEFHGSNKPTGENRTWPNELSRESIRGMEASRMTERAQHNTTLPFTRFLAGHADYTPMHFGERRRETSWAHQIASAAIFTSPLLIYAAHPRNILDNPAVELIKSIPSVWDQTVVLGSSEIGELAIFARRTGSTWFLAIMNGPTARKIDVKLEFLPRGNKRAILVRDNLTEPAAVKVESAVVNSRESLAIDLRAGGGFSGRFG
jgi:alpha-glucosidase